jgi:hypothetical protein
MNIGFANRIGFAALLLLSGSAMMCAEEPARSRGTPIIFSGSKSDVISTNLNDLRTPSRSLHDLESGLKQALPGIDSPRPGPDLREYRNFQRHTPPQTRQSLKDNLNQRAEEMFLNPERYDAEKEDEALFQLDRLSLDPSRAKSRNSLEQFDERQRNERAAPTNPTGLNNPFGTQGLDRPNELKPDAKLIKPIKTERNSDARPDESLSAFPRNATESSAMDPERSPMTRYPSGFNRPIEAPTGRQQEAAEVRMDNFKRLLEGPRYTPPANTRGALATAPANYSRTTSGNLSTAPATRSAVTPSSASGWSAFKSATKDETKPDFTKSAGLVGSPDKLEAFPEFPTATAALEPVKPIETTVAPVKKTPPATFKLPQRRF